VRAVFPHTAYRWSSWCGVRRVLHGRPHASHRTSPLQFSDCTARGSAASYSAWRTPIAGVAVLALFLWGCWVSRPCPRAYLHTRRDQSRGPSLQRFVAAFTGTMAPSDSLPAPIRFRAFWLIRSASPDVGRRVGPLLFRIELSPRATASTPGSSTARSGTSAMSMAFTVTGAARPSQAPFG